MKYRRLRTPGGSYFFTVVTYQRQPLFTNANSIALLREAIQYVRQKHPFTIDAFVLLPDHLHCIWTLPSHDEDFSTRWMLIKSYFTRQWCKRKLFADNLNIPTQNPWQNRFWEHALRGDDDFYKHLNYIHYNPVKHGLIQAPKDWPYSSFHRCVKEGFYDINWGRN